MDLTRRYYSHPSKTRWTFCIETGTSWPSDVAREDLPWATLAHPSLGVWCRPLPQSRSRSGPGRFVLPGMLPGLLSGLQKIGHEIDGLDCPCACAQRRSHFKG